jgi:phytoene desaturase
MTRAVVIGGGIAGLATAALLAREGMAVTLVEARNELGGRAGVWEKDGFRFDTGPSWYLMPEVFDHFFHLMGTSAAEQFPLERLDPGYRVFFEGHDEAVDVRSGRAHAVALFESLEPGAGAHLERYLDSAEETYGIALQSFLYTTFTAYRPLMTRAVLRRARRLVRMLREPLADHAARSFADERLRQILGYPAVFLGADPRTTPSIYHLMSHLDLDDGVWYPQGGIATVIASVGALARQAGAMVRTNARVTAIETVRTGRRSRVRGVRISGANGAETMIPADIVVSAADLHHTETQLLPPELATYPPAWWERRDPGPGAVLVYLGVRGGLDRLAHHSLFFTADWDANFSAIFRAPTRVPDPASVYVCRPSATDDSVAPTGHENLFLLVPVPADPATGAGGEGGRGDAAVEAVADAAIAQVAAWAGIPDLAERIVVRRTVGPADFADDLNAWRGGALGPGHTLRQSAFLRAGNASRRVDGLLYAGGGTIPGIGLPMCLISAELVVKRLRGDVSTTPLEV